MTLPVNLRRYRMQGFGDNFTPVILLEDERLHTDTHPFCSIDPHCPCHEDQELIQPVAKQVQDGLFTPEEATRFTAGKTI
jgi:hypothetical protein